MPKKDITGFRFGRLVALREVGQLSRGRTMYWLCRCDCGTEKPIARGSLGRSTKSCGCFRREHTRDAFTKHGQSKLREYGVWKAMVRRCHAPNEPAYDHYGGRGIIVCDRWRFSFANFLTDMGKRPSDGHSIDRIDPDGPYAPTNCRWVTWDTQAANRRPELARADIRALLEENAYLKSVINAGADPEDRLDETPCIQLKRGHVWLRA